MADRISSELRSELMSKVKSKGNKTTELTMVTAFRKVGVRGWLRHVKLGRCRPDFVFRKERVVVFLDGCFWHCCPLHGTVPKSNREFWRSKLDSNSLRDAKTNLELARVGWSVLRFWEHSIRRDAEDCAATILDMLEFSRRIKDA